jgi:hypothetical protein
MNKNQKKIILFGMLEKIPESDTIYGIEYTIFKEDNYPHDSQAMGMANATRIDDHYLLIEYFNDHWTMGEWFDIKRVWYEATEKTVGIVHTPKEANQILYDRMKKRAQQVALLDNREFVEKLEGIVGLE